MLLNTLRLTAFLAALLAALPTRAANEPAWVAYGDGGMVAADHPEASAIGAAILRAGGNAFDAAIATSAALTVTRPESTGIGGGGFMVAYIAGEKRFIALDFREMAPASATPKRFAALHERIGEGASASIFGGNAVGVPGLVAGWREVHRRFGTREWKSLLEPAAALASKGFALDKSGQEAIESALEEFKKYPEFNERFVRLKRRLAPDGAPRASAGVWVREDVAATLQLLAARGPDAFYGAPIAAAIVDAVNQAGGAMTPDDLRNYKVIERPPLQFETRSGEGGRDVRLQWTTMPPPSSGGACLAQLVQVSSWINALRAQSKSPAAPPFDDPLFEFTSMIESMKHAFANRARFLADPDFSRVDISHMIGPEYAGEVARQICSGTKPPTLDAYGLKQLAEDHGTSHFSIVDRAGNAVAWTETINGGYGSYVVAEPYGIILNNQIDDFTTVVGAPNLFGLEQSKANLVGPGKRPLSSMTPTIVLRDGKLALVISGSGGPRIITAVFQVAQAVLAGAAAEIMTRPRLHHQWRPDEVFLDRKTPDDWTPILDGLRERGYSIATRRRGAAVQYIQIDSASGRRTGVCDPRKGGRPAAE